MAKKTFSVLIAWDDTNREAGDYGWTGRAKDAANAEKQARAAMKRCHIENYRTKGETIAECCAHYMNDGVFGGRVIEIAQGAIWSADELETSLDDLLRWGAANKAQGAAWDRARVLLKTIREG